MKVFPPDLLNICGKFFFCNQFKGKFQGHLYAVSLKVECSPKWHKKKPVFTPRLKRMAALFELGKAPAIFWESRSARYRWRRRGLFWRVPLTQKYLPFIKVYSSISEKKGIHSFTIDGTVVSGNAGGPVLMQKNGKLHLIGVIESGFSICIHNLKCRLYPWSANRL